MPRREQLKKRAKCIMAPPGPERRLKSAQGARVGGRASGGARRGARGAGHFYRGLSPGFLIKAAREKTRLHGEAGLFLTGSGPLIEVSQKPTARR